MYVNMSELANLAASKAQEMVFPLPPPPPPELSSEKVHFLIILNFLGIFRHLITTN